MKSKRQRGRPQPSDGLGRPDDRHHDLLEPGGRHGAAELRQRVHPAGHGVDQVVVVVLPTGLHLLRPVVMVDGDDDPAGAPRRRGQVDRRLPAVRADLEQRAPGGRRRRRRGRGEGLTLGPCRSPGRPRRARRARGRSARGGSARTIGVGRHGWVGRGRSASPWVRIGRARLASRPNSRRSRIRYFPIQNVPKATRLAIVHRQGGAPDGRSDGDERRGDEQAEERVRPERDDLPAQRVRSGEAQTQRRFSR